MGLATTISDSGSAVSNPSPGAIGGTDFALFLLDGMDNPLLTDDPNGSIFDASIAPKTGAVSFTTFPNNGGPSVVAVTVVPEPATIFLLLSVLVVMNDEIHGARDVTKTNTYRVETFRAPELGYLGYADADRVSFYRTSTKRHTVNSEFAVSGIKQLPKVEIVYSYVQPSEFVLRALLTGGVNGIVFAGTGAGLISSFERKVGFKGIPVIFDCCQARLG